jgi:hypothetical protein
LTALAAKGAQVDRLKEPLPLMHHGRPPQSPAPAPWTPLPPHEPLPSTHLSCLGLHTAKDNGSSPRLWRGGHHDRRVGWVRAPIRSPEPPEGHYDAGPQTAPNYFHVDGQGIGLALHGQLPDHDLPDPGYPLD